MENLNEVVSQANHYAKMLAKLESEAMECAQVMNMHGLKRLHEKQSNYYWCKANRIAKDGIDMSKKPLIHSDKYLKDFASTNPRNHLENIIPILKEVMNYLIQCNKKSIEFIGMPLYEELQSCLYNEIMDYERWLKSFADCNWDYSYVYLWDKKLHDKIKKENQDKNY